MKSESFGTNWPVTTLDLYNKICCDIRLEDCYYVPTAFHKSQDFVCESLRAKAGTVRLANVHWKPVFSHI